MNDPGDLVVPGPAACKVLCEWLKDEQEFKRVREEAAVAQGVRPVAEGKARPVRVGKEDAAEWLGFIPPEFYWSRRRSKSLTGLFNTEAGIKDLRRHHPEFMLTTTSGKATVGWTAAREDSRPTRPTKRRVHFDRNTFQAAK